MQPYLIIGFILLTGAAISVLAKKLTPAGGISGALVGFIIFLGSGWTGLTMMAVFFILGTVATAWKRSSKERLDLAEKRTGRNAGQVGANAGGAVIACIFILINPHFKSAGVLLVASCFSSAMADTLSSELGTVYGKRFYDILSFSPGKKGADGVVSREGTLIGLIGSAVIAFVYCLGNGFSIYFLWIIVAGTAGNVMDSILGATLERQGLIKNDLVNLLNTITAGLIMLLLYSVLH